MNLEREWRDGVVRVRDALSRLPGPRLAELKELCRLMMEKKRAMQALSARVDAACHCASCGGACCVKGKFHVTPVDLLAYLVTEEELFRPLFDNGLCPYLAPKGCLMPPEYRPFNCITFNCELIEDELTREEVESFYGLERELRGIYREIRGLFPEKSADGALLQGEAESAGR